MQKNFMIFFFYATIMILMLFMWFMEKGIISMCIMVDDYFLYLCLMTTTIMIICLMFFSKTGNSMYIAMLNFLLFIIFLLTFLVDNMILFYVLFEMSVLPLMFFISSWGYSLERIKAMMYMFLYTILFSMPFLFLLFYYSKSYNMNITYMSMFSFEVSQFMCFFMLLMFLMKMPMWGFHLWLTKAHVEASTEGSMILAGVVLKLAGVGMMKFIFLSSGLYYNSKISNILASITIMGALFLSFYSARQTDSKLIVAISSIVHMSFLFLCFLFMSTEALFTLVLVMVAHGIISPLMFLFLGYLYEVFNSRTLHLMKGILQYTTYISMAWFMVCIFNMGIPLTMNFFSEILFFISSLSFSSIMFMLSCLLVFSNGMVNMYMFNFLSSGKNNEKNYLTLKKKSLMIFYTPLILIIFISLFLY